MMKAKNRVLKGLLIAGMLASVTITQAQGLPHGTLKVVYPGNSTIVEIPSSQDRYIEERAVLTPDDEGKLTSALRRDSVGVAKKQERDWSKWRPNPKCALWLTLVIPGAEQVYDRRYRKLPIFYGGFVGCIYAVTWGNQIYHDYVQTYMDIMGNNPTTQSYSNFLHLGTAITPANEECYKNIFKQRKGRYRRWRGLSIFTTITVYTLSVANAYVDTSLSDFDISDDLSLHIAPAVISNKGIATPSNPFHSSTVGIGCSLTF